MATPADAQLHVVADSSKPRALVAVLVPFAFPFILALALAKSRHSVWDYSDLIASGQLSFFRQGIMWVALAAFTAIYVPPALTALARRIYLASTSSQLITPSGERFDLANIRAISVRKTFWHKVLLIELPNETRRLIITFARPLAPEIRDALKADPNLRDIPVA
jgi:hypothetical protein